MKRFIIAIIAISSYLSSYAQMDTEFWFAAPFFNCPHGDTSPYKLVVFSFDQAATVTISMPANPSFTPITRNIPANGYTSIVLANNKQDGDNKITSPYNSISQRGLLIQSTSKVECYYQVDGDNSEAYTLKGKNALGRDFLVIGQKSYYAEQVPILVDVNSMPVDSVYYTNRTESLSLFAHPESGFDLSNIEWTLPDGSKRYGSTLNLGAFRNNLLGEYSVTGTTTQCGVIDHPFVIKLNTVEADEYASFCEGDSFTWPNHFMPDGVTPMTFSVEGTYRDTITSASGSDSICILHLTSIPLPDMTIRPDTTIMPGDSAILWARGVVFCRWTPGNSLSKTSDNLIYVHPTQTTTYTARGYSLQSLGGNNLVYNGDFEQGNIGFGTQLRYFTPYTSPGVQGDYTITDNVKGFWPLSYITSVKAYNGIGNMMVVDGKTSPNSIVWSQQVVVEPNTYYAFSAQVMSCLESNLRGQYALLQFSINGTQLGPVLHSPNQLYVWTQYYEIWYSGNNTTATLTILNQNSNGFGNDFALDEIRFDALDYSCEAIKQVTINVKGQDTDSTEIASICAGDTYTWHGRQFNTTTTITETIPNSAGGDSVCTLLLTVLEPSDSIEIATICAGETYTWHGRTYNATTTQTETLTNAAGCDSVCTLQLTVLDHTDSIEVATVCAGETYTWHGQTFSSSTTQTETLTNAAGCDSVCTLQLTVLDHTDSIEVATVCAGETYTWHGQTFSSSTTQTETLTNAAGCDSVCTLQLTVLPALSGDTSAIFCKGHPFVWHGNQYANPGDYTHTYASETAPYCDSIVTLHLFQKESSDSIEVATICAGETYTWHGRTYNATTTQTETLTNAAGCDSVCTLQLIVLPPITTDISAFITEGASFTWNGQTYTVAGDYPSSFTTDEGCDSVVTLHLTVNPLTYEILTHTQCADDPYVEFEVVATDALFHHLQFAFAPNALNQHFRDTIVDFSNSFIQIPNSARAGIYDVAISTLLDNQVLDTRSYQFTLLYPSSVLDQHWDDFIGVLTYDYNGGYNFSGFQWYKDGTPIPGENHSYLYQPLEMGASYSAMLEEADGTKLMTCDLIAVPQTEIALYPTLLQPHQLVRLHSSDEVMIQLYNNLGTLVSSHMFSSGDHQFVAPSERGVYIVKLQQTSTNGKSATKKLLVK